MAAYNGREAESEVFLKKVERSMKLSNLLVCLGCVALLGFAIWLSQNHEPEQRLGTSAPQVHRATSGVDKSPEGVSAGLSTSGSGEVRAKMSSQELRDLRSEFVKAHSPRRWPRKQQARFVTVCLRGRSSDLSLNERVCNCYLEFVMQNSPTFGAYAGRLADEQPAEPDEKAWIGMCAAAFGD